MTIQEIDEKLIILRKEWVTASKPMKEFIENRAKLLKSIREDLEKTGEVV